ncbi:dTDP-4-dehydrorhamnose 3,5-epimerase family protein [Desulfospira joergensenii]|uniref:dTDP-4-dehydrorhamnose 3,5-epimerase family protein n=1 Tax=Desulfospira joergensenii TaxID=53329 RepID=UPI0003B3E87D|nr:dTDP-4-dehydrorhamnose 3,5-epimerase family protein [Desulfospira joergensenii]
MLKVEQTKLTGVKLIKPSVFEDFRGEYIMTYSEEQYLKNVVDVKFVEDDISVSNKNVLRGLHGDSKTWKLVSCLHGKFYLVVVNCDEKSSFFGQWESFTLSSRNRHQVLIPPNHGNGHLVLSDTAIFHYKQSQYYNPDAQFTYKWDDPRFKIWWPTKSPILSMRDESGYFAK